MQTKTPTIKARYSQGVLQLLENISFPEGAEVNVRIEASESQARSSESENLKDKHWLETVAQDTASRLAALEAELPEDEVASWHKAMKQAAKPARYIPGKGVFLQERT